MMSIRKKSLHVLLAAATALFATFHSSPRIALYILGCGAIGLVSVLLLTDYTNRDVSQEYEGV